ncbi:DUF5615 family PIN-like protein [Patescibacteria group bacterium]|nr:DUF5615 family PIN-like protein [Patescibacteria group bacterium]
MLNDKIPTLYLNENVPIRLVDILSHNGITAIHTVSISNQGASDEFQLEYAANQKYMLVSHNRRHFRRLHTKWMREGRLHHGILVMSHGEPEYLAERIGHFFDDIYPTLTLPFCVSPPR